jgi:hypothetical protein
MMQRFTLASLTLLLIIGGIALPALLLSAGNGNAVQQPRISIDMNGDSNSYTPSVDSNFDGLPDAGSNVMTVGSIENCFTHPAPGDNAAHLHGFGGANTTDPRVQLIIENVEDATGYQARINFDGTRLAITSPGQIDHTPFDDGTVPINFLNLPVDEATQAHKTVFGVQDIPDATTANATALIGAVALAVESAGTAPDVPPKATHDETTRTYSATGGGVLAQIQFVVRAGQASQSSLFLDLDDGDPHNPGSKVNIFTPTGLQSINLSPTDLGDGFHGEGVACLPPPQGPPGGPAPPPAAPGGASPAPGAGDGGDGDGAGDAGDGAGDGGDADGGAGTDGASPSRTATTSPTPDSETSDEDGADDGDDDGGTPFWLFVLIAVVVALAGGGAYAAWRFRSRLPWLGR